MFIAETRTTISEKSELKIAAHLSDEMNRYKTLVSFCSDDMHDHAWSRADINDKSKWSSPPFSTPAASNHRFLRIQKRQKTSGV